MWLAKQKHLLLTLVRRPPPHPRLVLSSSSSSHLLFTSVLRFCSVPPADSFRTTRLPPPPSSSQFMVDYLVSSCELSHDEAVKASARLSYCKSQEKPEAVVRLLKREGLSVSQIRRVVKEAPRLLRADPDKTLEPKIRALRGAGFSGSELAQLISACPAVLQLCCALPRIEFWRDLLGNNQNLLKAAIKFRRILNLRPNDKVVPRLSLLCSMGIPRHKIGTLILKRPCLVGYRMDRIKAVAEQVKSMGFKPGSGLFPDALSVVLVSSMDKVDARFKLLRSFGWSQANLLCAFRGFPNILTLSEKKICSMMGFLLKEAGCDPLYIARHPVLLGFSLEKRLMPRYSVLQFLGTKGLPGGKNGLSRAMYISEKKFVERYITPNSENFPQIIEIYHAVGVKATPS